MKYKGFTIIELLIGITLFMLVVGTAVSLFLSIVQHQRKILAQEQLLSQVSYAQERMSKALRMAKEDTIGSCIPAGYIYQLTRPDISSGLYRGIRFINQSAGNACQEFLLDNAVSGDAGTPLVLKELINSSILLDAVPLTADNLEINSIRFGIDGADGCYGGGSCPDGSVAGSGIQPRVTVLLRLKVSGGEEGPIMAVQTTISQRNLNQ